MKSSILGSIALVGLVAWSVLGPVEASGDPEERIGSRLRERLATAQQSEEIAVNVVLRDAGLPERTQRSARRRAIRTRQQGVLDSLPVGSFIAGPRYQNINGLSLRTSPDVIHAIARHPDTELVYEDGRVFASLSQGVVLVGADHAHALGVTGTGVTVAVLDTGIDTDHPDLVDDLLDERCWCRGRNGPRGCCPNRDDSQSGSGSAEDDEGHGTSVSGVITSAGVVASPGVAPDAKIVAIKILASNGSGTFSDIDLALDWLLDNHVSLSLRIVNLSLGDGIERSNPALSPCSGSNTSKAIKDLRTEGVITFVASGNEGHDDGISFPACVPDAISVGGVYDGALGSVSWCGNTCGTILCTDSGIAADDFVCHTNSDEILDLLAPDYRTTTTDLGGGVVSFGGTSAASPYAAAIAALLVEQDPARSPDDIQSLMTSNGPMVTNSDNGLSFRRTDLEAIFAVCGDGIQQAGEDCDDGNLANGDCCSDACAFETSGSACSDADACTTPDACDGAGGCVSGAPLVCDDGAYCNGVESCDSVSGCQAGTPPTLGDGVTCTIDACDETNDVVTHTPDASACDDGLFCNGVETCHPVNDCEVGAAPDLDDGVVCTVDTCDEDNDLVVHTPDDGGCSDGLFCNGPETCHPVNDCEAGVPPSLGDGVACTVDTCDELADVSVHTPDDAFCDDGDPCTAESCDELFGCVTEPGTLCPVAVPGSRPMGLFLLAGALVLLGSAWLSLARSDRAIWLRGSPR